MPNKLTRKKYKALICDVDGTLIPLVKNGLPSKILIDVFDKAKDVIHIGIATSRPLEELQHILSLIHLSGPSIINGGSIIIDGATQKVLWEKTIDQKSYQQILKIVHQFTKEIIINDEGRDISFNSQYQPKKINGIWLPKVDLDVVDNLINELSKISTLAAHKVTMLEKDSIGVDITHIEATKQHGILEIATLLNIKTNDIIGVGDGYNDFPLLMACGLKVAMGNAVEDLKAIADYVAPSVEEDGVVDVINKFIFPYYEKTKN